jgi:hypothetical protein
MKTAVTLALFATAAAAALPAAAVTLTASAISAQPIPSAPVDAALNLQNGDFLILANPAAGPGHVTGDGVDETTRWSFDFASDPDYAAALADGHIVSARLTMRLSTQFFVNGVGPWTDIAFPTDGTNSVFPGFVIPEFMTGTPGTWEMGSITTDLINDVGMNGTELFAFMSSRGGLMPFQYGDDAVVGFAQLELVTAPVPEPAAWMLLAAGLLPLLVRRHMR